MTAASRESPIDRGPDASREILASRVATLPDVLRAALAADVPEVPAAALATNVRFIVTGIGGSEGPARIIATALRTHAGCDARFVAMSAMVCDSYEADSLRDVLVIVSHGLSPNSRSVLGQRHRFAACVLFTGRSHDDIDAASHGPALTIHTLPPRDESNLLVRVLAPPAATLGALQWIAVLARARGREVGALARLNEVPEAVAQVLASREEPQAIDGARVGIVSIGEDGESFAHGLRWKWLEAVGRGDPPCWDALAFAHGPFQDLWNERAVIWTLMHGDARRECDVAERLASMMHPSRHHVVRLFATLPRPLGWFEHDAWFDRAALRELRDHPRDLANWPGKGRDEALYELT